MSLQILAAPLTLLVAPQSPPAPQQHRVVVSGGTHGNEYTGVYVLERLAHRKAELRQKYPSLQIETLFANPKAHANK